MKFNIDLNLLGHSVLANGVTLALLGGSFYTAWWLFDYKPHFCEKSNNNVNTAVKNDFESDTE